MAASPHVPVTEYDLQGFKYFRLLGPLFAHWHAAGRERDRAGNRHLFYDQYATLLLWYFFSPTVTSLRGLQQASTLATVQQRLGIRRTALGSLSEAAQGFDASLRHEVIATLGGLWVGRPPTKRTYEMLCFYLSGWASEAEVIAHLNQLHRRAQPPSKS
jgi:hypothetical protein